MNSAQVKLIRRVLQLTDVTLLVIALVIAQRTLPYYRPVLAPGPATPPVLSELIWLLIAALAIWPPVLSQYELYRISGEPLSRVLGRLGRASIITLGAVALFIFALKISSASRVLVFAFVGISAVLLAAVRCVIVWFVRRRARLGLGGTPVLLVGTGSIARETVRRARARMGPLRLVGALAVTAERGEVEDVAGLPVLGGADDFRKVVQGEAVDAVIVATAAQTPEVRAVIAQADELGLAVFVAPAYPVLEGMGDVRLRFEEVLDLSVVSLARRPQDPAGMLVKRLIDIAVSAALLLVLSPLLLVLTIAVKFSSPGPIFYPWRVMGKNNRRFVGYKFRTMVANADGLKPELAARNQMKGPVFKIDNDPRVTRLGRIMRKFSLDELPQLWTVLKGDMSLVGPRPPFPAELERFEFWQRRKLSVKPGITCLWQVNGRHRIQDFREWVELDLDYIDNWSLLLDFKILVRTIPVVVRGTGA